MILKSINELFLRDLEKLKSEIESYSKEDKIWLTPGDIKNSAGNLALHVCGNLQHFVGAILGNSGYIREREKEFSIKNLPANELLMIVEKTISALNTTLGEMSDEDLEQKYPIEVLGYEMTTGYFLIHLTGHLVYHLGQINYHRRLLDN